MSEKHDVLLEISNLRKYFTVKGGSVFKKHYVQAVESVSFSIYRGETLGLVGESGCGKTTVGRSILRLYEPTGGTVKFEGTGITAKNIGSFRKEM